MKKKYTMLVLLLCSVCFLAGWGKKNVELLDDKKLIDLNAAIERCIPGANEAEQTENEGKEEKKESEDGEKEKNPAEKENIEEAEMIRVIRVRNRTITYRAVEYTDVSKLKEKIRQDNGRKVTFKLVDDFAEAHIYKEVMFVLTELESEIGLKYSKD